MTELQEQWQSSGAGHDQRVQHSSKDPNWRTPGSLFEALHAEFNFQLDVAADENNHLCHYWFGPEQTMDAWKDGLRVGWNGFEGAAFMNPPYSKVLKMPIDPWLRKAWSESVFGVTVVGIIPYNTQTQWWRRWVVGLGVENDWTGHAADQIRILPRRVSFLRPDGASAANAPGNVAVVVWKPNPGWVGPWQPTLRYWNWREYDQSDSGKDARVDSAREESVLEDTIE